MSFPMHFGLDNLMIMEKHLMGSEGNISHLKTLDVL